MVGKRRTFSTYPGLEMTVSKVVQCRPYGTSQELAGQQIGPAAVYAKVEDYLIAKQK